MSTQAQHGEPSGRAEITVHPLASLDSARFAEIAGGYSARQRYAVRKVESDSSVMFSVELQELSRPFVKRWSYSEEELQQYRRIIAEHRCSLGAYDSASLVGMAIAEPRKWNRSLWVWEFHVHADYRRQGIGKRLMGSLADLAGSAGLATIVCETQNTNVPAVRFYRSVGFVLDGVDLSYYPPEIDEVAFFMKLHLPRFGA